MNSLLRIVLATLILCISASPAAAAWLEAKSRHFIIYSDDKPERLHRYAERLERFDQAARAVLGMDDPSLTDSQRLVIYVLRSDDAVGKLMGSGLVSGFYDARADGAFAFVPRHAGFGGTWDLNAEQIFFHEYAHHLQLQFTSSTLPEWVTEGFAEFFATAEINDDGVKIGSPPRYRALGLHAPTVVPLTDILGAVSRRRTNLETEQFYGRSWQLVHFLNFDSTRKGQLGRYVEGIQRGMQPLESAKAAFGDLDKLATDLWHYRGRRTIPALVVAAQAISVGNISIRPLRAGEAAIMDVHIRSRRGVDDKTAKEVAAAARRIAGRFPNDPFVQATLAEAEFDAAEYGASEAAADRALAVDPNRFRALIYKGRSKMEAGRERPNQADWTGIRSWFLRANKLDTESAEPLYLYFQSFVAAKERPSKNAIEGLLYAVALAPQDDSVRLMAVQQLLIDDRLPEAGKLFEPLAYRPHLSDEWRAKGERILDAIAAGDAQKALGQMNGEDQPEAAGPAGGGSPN